MYDKGKVIAGLVIFVALFAFPFWYTMGKSAPAPEVELTDKAKQAKQCVEPTPFMTGNHMQVLIDWREAAVRENDRIYIASDGKHYTASLQNTCMDCHANKSKFCDRCHNYMGVDPYCWDCHIEPKEKS